MNHHCVESTRHQFWIRPHQLLVSVSGGFGSGLSDSLGQPLVPFRAALLVPLVDAGSEVFGCGLIGRAAAAGVVLEHDLDGVALAAADR